MWQKHYDRAEATHLDDVALTRLLIESRFPGRLSREAPRLLSGSLARCPAGRPGKQGRGLPWAGALPPGDKGKRALRSSQALQDRTDSVGGEFRRPAGWVFPFHTPRPPGGAGLVWKTQAGSPHMTGAGGVGFTGAVGPLLRGLRGVRAPSTAAGPAAGGSGVGQPGPEIPEQCFCWWLKQSQVPQCRGEGQRPQFSMAGTSKNLHHVLQLPP